MGLRDTKGAGTKVKSKNGNIYTVIGNAANGRKIVKDANGQTQVLAADGTLLKKDYVMRDVKQNAVNTNSKSAQQAVLDTMKKQLASAQKKFNKQLGQDGWAADVADGISNIWGVFQENGNQAWRVRKDLQTYTQNIQLLQKAAKQGDAAFNEKFKQLYGKDFDQKAMAEYVKNPTTANYKKVFGTKNDIKTRVDKYNKSQQIGAEAVKTTVKIGAGAAVGIATGGTGFAALGVAAAGTAAASLVIDETDRLKVSDAVTKGEIKFREGTNHKKILTNAAFDGVSVMAGGIVGKAAIGVTKGAATMGAKAARVAMNTSGDVVVGAVQEYVETGNVTAGGVISNAAMSAVGGAVVSGTLQQVGKGVKYVKNKTAGNKLNVAVDPNIHLTNSSADTALPAPHTIPDTDVNPHVNTDTEVNTIKASGLHDLNIPYASVNTDINKFFTHIGISNTKALKRLENEIISQTNGDPAKIKELTQKLCLVKDTDFYAYLCLSQDPNRKIELNQVAEYAHLLEAKFPGYNFIDWRNAAAAINSSNKTIVKDLIDLDGIDVGQVYNVLSYCDTPAKMHHVQTIIDDIKAGKEDIIALPFVKHSQVSTKAAQARYARTPEFGANTPLSTVLSKTKQGQVATVGSEVYINDCGKMTKLQMDAKTYKKLFPAYETNVLQQGNSTGDCYFLSGGLIAFQRNDNARPYLLKMIKQNGNDIVITFPGYPNNPVRFKNGELSSGELHIEKTSQGNLLLEQAYAKAKYAANHKIKDASSVDTDTAMKYIHGGNTHLVMNEIIGCDNATLYIRNSCKEDYKSMRREKGYDFKKHKFLDEDKKDEILDKLAGKDNVLICAASGARDAGYLPDYGVTPHHAYYIENIDKTNKTVTIVNPHNSLYSMTLSYEKFWEGFSTLSVKELPV